jgi:hypothetical protein
MRFLAKIIFLGFFIYICVIAFCSNFSIDPQSYNLVSENLSANIISKAKDARVEDQRSRPDKRTKDIISFPIDLKKRFPLPLLENTQSSEAAFRCKSER